MEIINKLEKYKELWLLRGLLVILSSVGLWYLCFEPTYRNASYSLVFVGFFEYMTINVIFDRDFYPADTFVDRWFPDKKSKENIVSYVIIYLIYMVGVFTAIFMMCSKT